MANIPVMQGIEIKDDKGKVVYTLYCKDAEGRADLAEYKKEVATSYTSRTAKQQNKTIYDIMQGV